MSLLSGLMLILTPNGQIGAHAYIIHEPKEWCYMDELVLGPIRELLWHSSKKTGSTGLSVCMLVFSG